MRTEVTAEQSSAVEQEVVQSTEGAFELGRSHALEATSVASGAIAGAVAGAAAGPLGVVAGGLIGSVIGAAAGLALGDGQRYVSDKEASNDEVSGTMNRPADSNHRDDPGGELDSELDLPIEYDEELQETVPGPSRR